MSRIAPMPAPVSDARLRANRENASRSTGPKSDEGRAATRSNALAHGLASRGKVVPAGMEQDVEIRCREWMKSYRTLDDEALGVLRQAALDSLRLEQLERQQDALRRESTLRAAESWDDDRSAEAHELGRKLAHDPNAIRHRLEQTPQGCAWLIARWREVDRLMCEARVATPAIARAAFDLLGTPTDLRTAFPQDPDGTGPIPIRHLAAAEIARLEDRAKRHLARIDHLRRETAQAGLDVIDTRQARLLNRYDREIRKRLQAALEWLAPLARPVQEPAPPPAPTATAPDAPAAPRTGLLRNGPTCQNGSRPGRVDRGFARDLPRARPLCQAQKAAPAVRVPCPNATG